MSRTDQLDLLVFGTGPAASTVATRFSGPDTVEIGERTVEAKHFLIATGSVPMDLPIRGKEHLTTSDAFLEIEQLPKKVVFVGGGYISFELKSGDWAGFNSMRKVGETHAAYKILVEKESGRFLGAHLLGPEAAELINFFVLAMKFDIKAQELKSAPIVFPTFAADLRSMI